MFFFKKLQALKYQTSLIVREFDLSFTLYYNWLSLMKIKVKIQLSAQIIIVSNLVLRRFFLA